MVQVLKIIAFEYESLNEVKEYDISILILLKKVMQTLREYGLQNDM